jgi:acyl-ACP thioesterase
MARALAHTGRFGMIAQVADSSATGLTKTLMPVPDPHPDVFDVEWPLRMADIDRDGRLRFDGAARHIQDVGQDHLRQL